MLTGLASLEGEPRSYGELPKSFSSQAVSPRHPRTAKTINLFISTPSVSLFKGLSAHSLLRKAETFSPSTTLSRRDARRPAPSSGGRMPVGGALNDYPELAKWLSGTALRRVRARFPLGPTSQPHGPAADLRPVKLRVSGGFSQLRLDQTMIRPRWDADWQSRAPQRTRHGPVHRDRHPAVSAEDSSTCR